MADLTEAQKESYWRLQHYPHDHPADHLVRVTYLVSGLWAGWLNQFSFWGSPGYYMAAQGRWRSSSSRSLSTPT